MDERDIAEGQRKCLKFVSAVRNISEVVKLLPIAFPIYKANWKIKLRVERTTGLVDRHLLEAVRDFGPISALEISEMTGLSSDIVERSLEELSRVGVSLKRIGDRWSLRAGTEIRRFFVEQTHEFMFLANAVTGNFLPNGQSRSLAPAMLNYRDVEQLGLVVLNHICSSAEGDIMRKVKGAGAAHRYAEYGIPDGFLKFPEKTPVRESAAFALAYLVVFADGSSKIVSATESAFCFECPRQVMDSCLPVKREVEHKGFFIPGIVCRDEGNQCFVRVENDALWRADSVPYVLRRLVFPGWICADDGTFGRLLPGDEPTARKVAVLRGCSLLRRKYARIRTDEDLAEVAEEFKESCLREFPELKRPPTFTEVLEEAADSRDDNLSETARRFLRRTGVVRIREIPVGSKFYSSNGDLFRRVIVKAIDSAKESIKIMSPVLEDDGVFRALERAKARGVEDICVLTRLYDHRNNIFKSDPQFESYELPRRRLAALGVKVRDCKYTVHAKSVIVDGETVFVTTANLNANGLGVGTANAIEAGLVYAGRSFAMAADTLFRAIWNHACYRQVRTDDQISIVSIPQAREIPMDACVQEVRGYTFLLSTPENQLLARRLAAMISSARETVDMISMSIYDLGNVSGVFTAINHALKRGVKIRVCARTGTEMFKAEQWPDPATKELVRNGVILCQYPHLHAKGVVVDGNEVLLMSANLNPFSLGSAPTAHIEVAVAGSTSLKPMSEFAAFVSGLFNSVSEVSCQD